MSIPLAPTLDRLLLRALPAQALTSHAGRLILPTTAEQRQRYRQWEVEACGPLVSDETLLPGTRVIVRPRAGQPFEQNGVLHLMVQEDDVIAWVDD